MLTYGRTFRPAAQDEVRQPALEDLLHTLEANGMTLWRLSREADRYIASARSYAERGVRWQRAQGHTPAEAVARLLQRIDLRVRDTGMRHPPTLGLAHPALPGR